MANELRLGNDTPVAQTLSTLEIREDRLVRKGWTAYSAGKSHNLWIWEFQDAVGIRQLRIYWKRSGWAYEMAFPKGRVQPLDALQLVKKLQLY